MPRPAKFTESQFLDATVELVAEAGPAGATMAAIASRVGAPTGSIYHRFASREVLLATLWLRTVSRFQEGFMEALEGPDVDQSALDAVQHSLTWARSRSEEARVLLLYRREELAERWPDDLGREMTRINSHTDVAIRQYAQRRYGVHDDAHIQRLRFVLADLPYAAMRRYLASGQALPTTLDDLVVKTARWLLSTENDAAFWSESEHHEPQ